ncbi:MAG TPA: hypothetical protein VFX39_07900 [Gemmatimonadaceae bacterium]|nr:hypothetical protein [Gemmatimonadaceae bacterium]
MTVPALDSSTRNRPLYVALYAVAAALILPSLMEFMLVSFPYRMGSVQWRFGAIGLMFNSVLASPIIGLTVAAFAAVQLGHRTTARIISIVALVIALVLLVALPFFLLDFFQLRAMVNPAQKRAFDLTSLKATLTGALMFITALFVAIGTWRATRIGTVTKASARGAARPAQSPLMMGASQG